MCCVSPGCPIQTGAHDMDRDLAAAQVEHLRRLARFALDIALDVRHGNGGGWDVDGGGEGGGDGARVGPGLAHYLSWRAATVAAESGTESLPASAVTDVCQFCGKLLSPYTGDAVRVAARGASSRKRQRRGRVKVEVVQNCTGCGRGTRLEQVLRKPPGAAKNKNSHKPEQAMAKGSGKRSERQKRQWKQQQQQPQQPDRQINMGHFAPSSSVTNSAEKHLRFQHAAPTVSQASRLGNGGGGGGGGGGGVGGTIGSSSGGGSGAGGGSAPPPPSAAAAIGARLSTAPGAPTVDRPTLTLPKKRKKGKQQQQLLQKSAAAQQQPSSAAAALQGFLASLE